MWNLTITSGLMTISVAHIPVHKEEFLKFGAGIIFFGVEGWFKRIETYGKSKGVKVEHFIISSGLWEMIEGTRIAKYFSRIYASGFMYDHNDTAHWPALALNYTTKTQYLFRINKGSLDVHDNSVIKKYVEPDARAVPFTNMAFIGDGETDIPSMRLVNSPGGHAIAVYPKGKWGAKEKAANLVKEGRANIAAVADYSEGSSIDKAIKAMIDKVAANQAINEASDWDIR